MNLLQAEAKKLQKTITIQEVKRVFECAICEDSGLSHPPLGYVVEYHSKFDNSITHIIINEHNRTNYSIPCTACKPLRDQKQMKKYQDLSKLNDAEREFRLDTMKLKDGKADRLGTIEMVKAGREILTGDCHMLTVWGTYGNGKSHFLKAMVNECLSRGIPALYINAFDLIQWVNDAFDKEHRAKDDETALGRIDMLKNVLVLAVDELGAFKETEWSISLIENIINHRWNMAVDGKSFTLFAMNENPTALTARIQSRIKETRLRKNGSPIIENKDSDVRPMRKI